MSVETRVAAPAFAFPLLTEGAVPNAMALTVVPPRRDVTKAEAKQALTTAVEQLKLARADERAATLGRWDRLLNSPLQAVRGFVSRHNLDSAPVMAGTAVAGVVISGALGVFNTTGPGPLFWTIFLTGSAISASALPLLNGVAALGKLQEGRARSRMVEAKQLTKPLQRLEAATGLTRAIVRADVKALRDKLHAARLLSPEALEDLDRAVDQSAEDPDDIARAGRYRGLASVVVGDIDDHAVNNVEKTLAACPAEERPAFAQALLELVFQDRKRVGKSSYETRNRLHIMLRSAAAAVPTTTAQVTDAS